MRRALELAERGRGGVGTNPLVGAVVVRGGRAVGEGWHAVYGGPHAEAVALARTGTRARGASLYVTLEPCSRTGKTPPCTRMIVAAGVRSVIAALADPEERGRGFAELKAGGIKAVKGVLEREARDQNREFLARGTTRRPYLILKLAMTLDGKIADFRSDSKWISSARARAWTRGLRRRVDAVMVGVRTALTDDPRLTAPGGGRQPLKIIVDSRARLPVRARLLRTGRTLVAATTRAPGDRLGALRLAGAEVVGLPPRRGKVPLRRLMGGLYARGVGAVLCEGGGELAGSLVAEGLVDRVLMVISPKIMGGSRSRPSLLGPDRPLGEALPLKDLEVRSLGPDTLLEGRPARTARLRRDEAGGF